MWMWERRGWCTFTMMCSMVMRNQSHVSVVPRSEWMPKPNQIEINAPSFWLLVFASSPLQWGSLILPRETQPAHPLWIGCLFLNSEFKSIRISHPIQMNLNSIQNECMNSYMDRNVAVEFKFKKYDLNSRNAHLHILEFNTHDLNSRNHLLHMLEFNIPDLNSGKQVLRTLELVLKWIWIFSLLFQNHLNFWGDRPLFMLLRPPLLYVLVRYRTYLRLT